MIKKRQGKYEWVKGDRFEMSSEYRLIIRALSWLRWCFFIKFSLIFYKKHVRAIKKLTIVRKNDTMQWLVAVANVHKFVYI